MLIIENQRVKVAGASLEMGASDMMGHPSKVGWEPFLATLKQDAPGEPGAGHRDPAARAREARRPLTMRRVGRESSARPLKLYTAVRLASTRAMTLAASSAGISDSMDAAASIMDSPPSSPLANRLRSASTIFLRMASAFGL